MHRSRTLDALGTLRSNLKYLGSLGATRLWCQLSRVCLGCSSGCRQKWGTLLLQWVLSFSSLSQPHCFSIFSLLPPASVVIPQHLNLYCFTSCCQEFSTLRLTSTPFFHVLCFFQFYSHYTAAVNGYKSREWLKALQEKNPLSAHAVLSKRVKCLLKS